MTKMPHSDKWRQCLSVTYDRQKADGLISRAQILYDEYCSRKYPVMNRGDAVSLKTRVLPGLSIYKALLETNGDREKVLIEVESLFRAGFFTEMTRGIRWLNHLPNPFFVVRPVLKMMTRDEYLPGSQEIVEDTPDCFALNVYRCFILDTLTNLEAQELTASFCKMDDWLSEAMPKVSWERTKTLGRGDDCCDFRWRR
jgi:hypothetical protein